MGPKGIWKSGRRPWALGGLAESASFWQHRMDLRPNLSELFQALHGDCIRRKIARARRKGVTYEEGTSEDLLRKFYRLTVLTRQRHKVPPQPLAWFRNLLACMGGKAKIRVASSGDQPAACILTVRFKATMTYKYGCSDPRFHKLGPMQLLLWKAIEEAKGDGLLEFDMGRSDCSNDGLVTFKDRWGAARSILTYLRYPPPKTQRAGDNLSMRIAKSVIGLDSQQSLARRGQNNYPTSTKRTAAVTTVMRQSSPRRHDQVPRLEAFPLGPCLRSALARVLHGQSRAHAIRRSSTPGSAFPVEWAQGLKTNCKIDSLTTG